ncbi:MAG TPA: SPOR domain-containing protein [Brevundimonas sp.]|jgi:hypothetical protein|uniref:SPOR domain-containing protein n=1 Tax=Brevundimonas sp. TaxID=1871086 RepID=UPI002DE5F6DD|nr:SPOR domain-containing protein [Brevundimonas sp.]
MSHEDPHRQDRGAYTPPTDDDLAFRRGGYDPRPRGGGGGGGKAPPVTLLVSAGVLLVLIIAVILYYRAGPRGSQDAPPTVGTPVGELKVEAPADAQPIDPAAGIDVYDEAVAPDTAPTFAPPPEPVRPRPEPKTETPPPAKEAPPAKETPAPPPAGGTAAVQIGAFSTPGQADQQWAATVGRYPQLTGGAGKRVQEVTSSSGSTLYRTSITGLTPDNARALCGGIRAAGGDCIVR